jgi:hypothetical protein
MTTRLPQKNDHSSQVEIKVKSSTKYHKLSSYAVMTFRDEKVRSVKITGVGHTMRTVFSLVERLKTSIKADKLFYS